MLKNLRLRTPYRSKKWNSKKMKKRSSQMKSLKNLLRMKINQIKMAREAEEVVVEVTIEEMTIGEIEVEVVKDIEEKIIGEVEVAKEATETKGDLTQPNQKAN